MPKWIYAWADTMAATILLLLFTMVLNLVLAASGHLHTAASLSGPISLLALGIGFVVDDQRLKRRKRARRS